MKSRLIFINRSLKLKSLQQQQQHIVIVVLHVFKVSLSANTNIHTYTHAHARTHACTHTTILPRPPCVTTIPKITLNRKENIQSSAAQPLAAGKERKRSPGEPWGDVKQVSDCKKRGSAPAPRCIFTAATSQQTYPTSLNSWFSFVMFSIYNLKQITFLLFSLFYIFIKK